MQIRDSYPDEFDNGFLRANELDEVIRLCNLDITGYYGELSDDSSDDDGSSSYNSGDDSDESTDA